MPTLKTRILFFLSSYAPLFLILSVRAYSKNVWLAGFFLMLTLAGPVLLGIYLRNVRGKTTKPITPAAATPKDNESVAYMLFYLFPFLDLDLSKIDDAFSLLIFLFVLGVLYVHSHMIYINPVLNLFGYHFYQIESEGSETYGLITKTPYVRKGDPLSVYSMSDYVIIEKSS